MSNIVENDIAFRTPSDFKIDAERRRWLESSEGQQTLEAERVWEERLHQTALIRSSEYSDGQSVLEGLLSNNCVDQSVAQFITTDFLTARQAVWKWIQSEKQAD